MNVKLQAGDRATVCRLSGALDLGAQDALQASLAPVGPGRPVIFEISEVPLVDSVGLAVLLRAVRQVRRGGGAAVICCDQPSVRRMLEAVVVPSNANVLSNEAAAKSYLAPPRAA